MKKITLDKNKCHKLFKKIIKLKLLLKNYCIQIIN